MEAIDVVEVDFVFDLSSCQQVHREGENVVIRVRYIAMTQWREAGKFCRLFRG